MVSVVLLCADCKCPAEGGRQWDSNDFCLSSLSGCCIFQEDVFTVTAIDLGPLKKLRIRHDNSGSYSSWYVDRVEIVDSKDDTT